MTFIGVKFALVAVASTVVVVVFVVTLVLGAVMFLK